MGAQTLARLPSHSTQPQMSVHNKENTMTQRADFRTFYREAHAVPNLSEREKSLIGLAVAMVRNCQP